MNGTGLWSLAARGGRIEELDPSECRRLLAGTHVGRLAYTVEHSPRVVPMNYVLLGERLLFRTSTVSEPARCAVGHRAAFEIDSFDEFLEAGWSVLVTGAVTEVDAATLRMLDLNQTPEPWPEGEHPLVLQMPLGVVTGRRVHQA